MERTRGEMTKEEIEELVGRQREFFLNGETLELKTRIKALKALREALVFYRDDIEKAMAADLCRTPVETYLCDIGAVLAELNETLRGLRKWARPERHYSGIMCFPSITTKVYKAPYGTVLIISPFNFPFMLSIGVLIPAIAGGNTAVIKASSKSPECTGVLQMIVSRAFKEEHVAVVSGSHEVADRCLAVRFDKIFYTGSPRVGVHVMTAAAANLTPVALELGGETGNWCVIRADANLEDAARKIAFFKILNAGQICININQVAVADEVADRFVELLKKEFIRQIGENAHTNPEYPRLISKNAYAKCAADAEVYKDRVVFGGCGEPDTQKFSPTIIYPVAADEEIVKRELFCPLLPVVPYKDDEVDKLLRVIEEREHGLAFYIFTKDTSWAESVMARMQFGGGCVNEVIMHLMVKGVPFNGTGHSGMGAYHGEWGFREFTHPKTVLFGKTRFNLSLREHPYDGKEGQKKLKMLKMLEK